MLCYVVLEFARMPQLQANMPSWGWSATESGLCVFGGMREGIRLALGFGSEGHWVTTKLRQCRRQLFPWLSSKLCVWRKLAKPASNGISGKLKTEYNPGYDLQKQTVSCCRTF